jgi:hypothetical protein
MAHFFKPYDAPPIGYDVDNKLAPGSVWRMQIPLGTRRTIALWGGAGWSLNSNNDVVVPNDGFEETVSGDVRFLSLLGSSNGTSLLGAGTGGAVWIRLQVQVGDVDARPGPLISAIGDLSAVWAVDGNHRFWDALTWADQGMINTTKIFSLYDLVKVCARHAIKYSRTIDYLAVFGHGTGGYQSVGAGQTVEDTGTRSLYYRGISAPGKSHLNGPAEAILLGLNGLLSRDATIFLAGCNVGEGGEGTGLLTSISLILEGRVVQAFENKVYYWFRLVGTLKRASGRSVTSSFRDLSI